jgi:hypothetical protein
MPADTHYFYVALCVHFPPLTRGDLGFRVYFSHLTRGDLSMWARTALTT